MKIQLAVAGLPQLLELRTSLACNLLHAANVSIDVHPWTGQQCDVVAVDLDDEYGRLIHDVAVRGQIRILAFSREAWPAGSGACLVARNAPISMIVRALRELLVLPAMAESDRQFSGLLSLCLGIRDAEEAVAARAGSIEILVRRAAGRVHTRSHSDLYAAETRLIDSSWSASVASKRLIEESTLITSRSLDTFLVNACRRHEQTLPRLDIGTYRLRNWPDLGGLVNGLDSLRLASALHASPWSVASLARYLDIPQERVNSFFVATLASGALMEESAQKTFMKKTNKDGEKSHAPSFLQRLARHFGMKTGHSHAEY